MLQWPRSVAVEPKGLCKHLCCGVWNQWLAVSHYDILTLYMTRLWHGSIFNCSIFQRRMCYLEWNPWHCIVGRCSTNWATEATSCHKHTCIIILYKVVLVAQDKLKDSVCTYIHNVHVHVHDCAVHTLRYSTALLFLRNMFSSTCTASLYVLA